MNYILLLILFFFIIIFIININGCKKITESFENDISTIINTNKDSIESIKKKLELINSNTSNILKNSNTLLFKSQSDSKNYNDLAKNSDQNIKENKEVDYDVNKLQIFKLLESLDEKELLNIMDIVRTNMTDTQKQILNQYVNVAISGKTMNESMDSLNK
jgi:hypothetical protein